MQISNNKPTSSNNIATRKSTTIKTRKESPKSYTSILEKEIDQMVYKLYGLIEGEIVIVEIVK